MVSTGEARLPGANSRIELPLTNGTSKSPVVIDVAETVAPPTIRTNRTRDAGAKASRRALFRNSISPPYSVQTARGQGTQMDRTWCAVYIGPRPIEMR